MGSSTTCDFSAVRFCERAGALAFNTGFVQGYTERMSQNDLVVVQSYATEGAAEIAKGVLESSIDAMMQADTAGRMREHLAWSGLGHRVLVR
jgi:hypothetical protein